jgi:ribonuclease T
MIYCELKCQYCRSKLKNGNKFVIINKKQVLAKRFRGFLPVVVDVETSGLNPATDAMLEIAIVTIGMDEEGKLYPDRTIAFHVEPFLGARIDPVAMEINRINLQTPLRFAVTEQHALHSIFKVVEELLIESGCQRAVWVGHNSWFDLAFIQAAAKRCHLTSNPFHSFTTFDTATLAAVALGETVLARAVRAANIPFDVNQAHSAVYDVERTAELFCFIVNERLIS